MENRREVACRWSAGSSSFGPEPLDCLVDQALLVFAHAMHATSLVRQSHRLKCPLCELPEMIGLLREHCGLFLHTTAELLFQQQGYQREPRNGVPASFLISSVIERGSGSAVALTLLFREVCRRAGLDVAVAALGGGTLFAVWPEAVAGVTLASAAQSLSVRGHRSASSPPFSQFLHLPDSDIVSCCSAVAENHRIHAAAACMPYRS
jgi:hypothetical protein